jgi:hypothetical protein
MDLLVSLSLYGQLPPTNKNIGALGTSTVQVATDDLAGTGTAKGRKRNASSQHTLIIVVNLILRHQIEAGQF